MNTRALGSTKKGDMSSLLVFEDNGSCAVNYNSIVQKPANRSPERDALQVSTLPNHIFRQIAMGDSRNALVNNRPLIKLIADEMSGGADNLNTALVGLMIRLAALEAGQKGVVDINTAPGPALTEAWRHNLHVARKNNILRAVVGQNAVHSLLLRRAPTGVCIDRTVNEGDAKVAGDMLEVWVVADDDGDF